MTAHMSVIHHGTGHNSVVRLMDITMCTSALLFTADDLYKRMPKDGKIWLLLWGTGHCHAVDIDTIGFVSSFCLHYVCCQ